MLKGRAVILFVTILSLAFISLALAITETSQIVPTSGSMSVSLMNSSNVTMNASVFIYVRDMEDANRIRFFNVTFLITQGKNYTYLTSIVDGSGIEVYVDNMRARETVSFRVKEIKVSPELSIDLNQLRIDLEPKGEATFYLDYDIIFSVVANTRLGTFSAASVRSFNYRSGDSFQTMKYERTHETVYLGVFFALTFCFFSSLAIWFGVPTWRTKIPLATLVVALSSVTLYTFFGSGYEVLANLPLIDYALAIYPISFLLHGYDNHLSGNLFFFLLVSLLMESWLSVRTTRKTFFTYYILPMLFTNISPGIGLSLSIESMTWALWTKIIRDNRPSTRFNVLLCVLSGIPSSVFLNWLVSYFQGGLSPYMRVLAIKHITYGIISAIVIFGLYLAYSLKRTDLKVLLNRFRHILNK